METVGLNPLPRASRGVDRMHDPHLARHEPSRPYAADPGHRRAGLAGLTVALHLARTHRWWCWPSAAAERGATAWAQGGIVGVLGATTASTRTCATPWTPAPARRRAHGAFIAERSAERGGVAGRGGRAVLADDDGPAGLHLTREAATRCAASRMATPPASAIHDALLAEARAPPEHHAARALDGARPHHHRHLERDASAALLRRLCADIDASASRRCRRGPWCWPPAGSARSTATRRIRTPPPATASRWPGAPAAGRQHGVHPVPPDLPVPPAGTQLPDHRGAARRGRQL